MYLRTFRFTCATFSAALLSFPPLPSCSLALLPPHLTPPLIARLLAPYRPGAYSAMVPISRDGSSTSTCAQICRHTSSPFSRKTTDLVSQVVLETSPDLGYNIPFYARLFGVDAKGDTYLLADCRHYLDISTPGGPPNPASTSLI